jgi:sialidase-1
MRICTIILTVSSCFSFGSPPALGNSPVVSGTQQQSIHPVLIRNEFNPLLRISVRSLDDAIFVDAISVTLEGSDDITDMSALQLFSTGDRTVFDTAVTFGDAVTPKQEIIFRGSFRLNKGMNIFWLSCRLKATAKLTHRVDAKCTRVSVSEGFIRPHDLTPNVSKRIGVALRKHNDDGVHTHRIPVLATTPKGTLLCAYDMRRRASRDLQEDIDIGLLRSIDGGQTWEAQRVIMDRGAFNRLPQEQNGCSDPGIVVDPQTGSVFVAAVWTWGRPGTHQWNKGGSEPGFEIGKTAQFLMVRSDDDGKTWSKPTNLTRQLKQKDWILFAPSPQQGIALKDGTLIMPGQGRDEKDRHFSNLMISRDHGQTWSLSNPASFGNTECQAVELSDGSIMLNCRSERPTKFRTVAITSDLGQSWKTHPTNRKGLIEPNCNGSTIGFEYLHNGKSRHVLLFANPHSQQRRDHHSIQVSLDDGLSWPKKYRTLLDAGLGRGYPSLSQIDKQHVGIVYEGSRADLVFERLSIEELLHPANDSSRSSPRSGQ